MKLKHKILAVNLAKTAARISRAINLMESVGISIEPSEHQENSIGNELYGALTEATKGIVNCFEISNAPRDALYAAIDDIVSDEHTITACVAEVYDRLEAIDIEI